MSFGSSTPAKTSTTTKVPKNLMATQEDALRAAGSYFNAGVGFNPYEGDRVADFSGQTTAALQGTQSIAQQGNPMVGTAIGAGTGLMQNGGLTNVQHGANGILGGIASGEDGINTGGQYDALTQWGSNPTASDANLQDFATGKNITGGSEAWQKALDYQTQKVADQGLRSLSANGRYGSAQGMQGIGDAIAGQRFGALANEQARQEGLMLQANGQIDSARANQFQGLLGSIGGSTNVQGQNIANRANAANSIFSNAQQGNTNTLNWASQIPQLNEARYYDTNQLLGAGTMIDAKSQQEMDANKALWDEKQSAPWARLGQVSNMANGGVGNYGSTTTTTAAQPSTAQMLLGGLVGGAGLLGKLGGGS